MKKKKKKKKSFGTAMKVAEQRKRREKVSEWSGGVRVVRGSKFKE